MLKSPGTHWLILSMELPNCISSQILYGISSPPNRAGLPCTPALGQLSLQVVQHKALGDERHWLLECSAQAGVRLQFALIFVCSSSVIRRLPAVLWIKD